jgi:hypothetical protein
MYFPRTDCDCSALASGMCSRARVPQLIRVRGAQRKQGASMGVSSLSLEN